MVESKDISIGEQKYIKWVDLDLKSNVFEVDLKTTEHFWKYLEIECVAECCGIDAFSFWREDIEKAKINLDDKNIKQELIDLKYKIKSINEKVISCSYLNNLFDKNVFIELLDHIIINL